VAEIGNVGKMKEERIYVSENKLEHFVTRLRTNKVKFSYVVYYESFKSGKGIDFTPSEVRKQTL